MRLHSPCLLGLLLLLLLPTIASATPEAGEGFFGDYTYSPYRSAIEAGLTGTPQIAEGYPDGLFRPESAITRAEFAKILFYAVVTEGSVDIAVWCTQATESVFPDVPRDAWFYGPLCMLQGMGVVDGYADGTFHPERNVNVAEASKMLVKAFRVPTDHPPFGQRVPWYWESALALLKVQALPPTALRFDALLTRGEMMAAIGALMNERPITVSGVGISAPNGLDISYLYAPDTFVETDALPVHLPGGQAARMMPTVSLVHTLHEPGCGLADDPHVCTPHDIDLALSFAAIPQSYAMTLAYRREKGQVDTHTTIAGRPAITYREGAEGFNAHYTFLPLDDDRTLMIRRLYLDTNVAFAHRAGILPIEEQDRLVKDVIDSLHLPPLGTKFAYTSVQLAFFTRSESVTFAPTASAIVTRSILQTPTIADETLRALFLGPTHDDFEQGAFTNDDLRTLLKHYRGIVVRDGVASVRFAFDPQEYNIFAYEAGRLSRAAITTTLRQFPSIRSVQFDVNGMIRK